MFCSDDKHPDELALHHINGLVKRSLQKGYDLFDVLCAASLHPVLHYKLPVGLLRENDPADFIVVNNLADFDILQTYINGRLVAQNGASLLPDVAAIPINNFAVSKKRPGSLELKAQYPDPVIKVIEAIEGQLVTNGLQFPAKVVDGCVVSDTDRDILKLVVINRYEPDAQPAIAFVKNFGLRRGALASTVAHDCHNIIAVGADDESICLAVNTLIDCKGGIAIAKNREEVDHIPLPVAGLMSLNNGYSVAKDYTRLNSIAGEMGTRMHAPFMTLSFMALLVIPALKLSDKGLFDGDKFEFTDVQQKSGINSTAG
jgi:adenine deaminase